MHVLNLQTGKGVCLTDVTSLVAAVVAESKLPSGLCQVFVPHSTAGVTLNSAIDGETPADIVADLNRMVPMRTDYVHQFDSPQDAAGHVKSSIVGVSLTMPVADGKLAIGSSQSLLFCEFDGPRHRKLYVTLVPGL